MGFYQLFSIFYKEGKYKYKKNILDNLDYEKNSSIFNIDELVDDILNKPIDISSKKEKTVKNFNTFMKRLSFKKFVSVALSSILLFAIFASASTLVDPDFDSTSINISVTNDNDIASSNTTTSDTNDTDGSLDNDSLFDNSIILIDQNETVPPVDVDVNGTSNETIGSASLNLSLKCDKGVYVVNETISIQGVVSYNNSLIDLSVNLLIDAPGLNRSEVLNTINGEFFYEFASKYVGNYTVKSIVLFENESVETSIVFDVIDLPFNDSDDETPNDDQKAPVIVDEIGILGTPFDTFEAAKNSLGASSVKIVNMNYFWDFFDRYSDWYLEAWKVGSGKWINVTEYLNIVRDRSVDNQFEKISLEFTAPMTTDYRLTYSIEKPLKSFVDRSDQNIYELIYPVGNNEEYSTYFNFSDIASLPNVILNHGVDNINGDDAFWFSVQKNNVAQGTIVFLDPILGNQGEGSSKWNCNMCPGGYFQMGSIGGTADNISAYLGFTNPGGNAICAIYNSSGNLVPNGITDEVSIGVTGWFTFPFSTSPSLTANNWYYLVVLSDTSKVELIYDKSGGDGFFEDLGETYPTFPDPYAATIVDADGLASIYCSYTPIDNDPPTPDPMTWSTEPYETSSSSITMIATIASDDTPTIYYYFNETTGDSGGSDSSWQSSDYNYTDSGLSENTQYGYEVKVKDSNTTPNEGNYSTPILYEYTDVDSPTNEELTLNAGTTWINATVDQPPNPTSGSTGSNFSWITGGEVISDWQNGIYYHNRTGLTENTNYGCQVQFRNGDADASSFNPSEKIKYTLCNPPTDGEFTIDGHGIFWINMSVAHPTNPLVGSTAAYFDCVTGEAADSGWVTDSESGRYYYNVTGLNSDTTYGYRVRYRNGNGIETTYTSEKQETTGTGEGKPIVYTIESTGVEETNATLNGWLQNNGTTDTTCYFLWGTNNPPTANNVSQGAIANGADFSYDTSGTGALTRGTLYYVDTKAVNNESWSESGGIQTFLTKPDPPTALTAEANTSTMIYLFWTSGTGANKTYIERNTAASWARGTGTEVYNGSSLNYEDSGVSDGTTYYYQAWSFSNWTYSSTTLHQWSDTYDSANNNTNELPIITNEVPANESTGVSLTPQISITVNDAEGDSMTITWYSNSSGSWQIFETNNSVGNGTYYQTNSNFSNSSTTYYWNVSVSTSTGINNSNTFYFTTKSFSTSVDTISPYTRGLSPLNITANASSDIENVTLYYRWSEDNQTWNSWNLLTFDSFEGAAFDWGNYTDGGEDCLEYTSSTYAHDGSNAVDIQDDTGDTASFYHTSGIDVDTPAYEYIKVDFWYYAVDLSSGNDFFVEYYDGNSWNTVKTYTQGTDFINEQFYNGIVWINESIYTFPSNMQIKFRADFLNNLDDVYIDEIYVNASIESGNGYNWSVWDDTYNPDTEAPWSWDFNFPNNTGYYEFYSIGKKSGLLDESAPTIADAICYYNANEIMPGQWDVGTTTIGNYNYSTSNGYFNLTNNDVYLNIQIKASNATNVTTGTQWNLTSTPGHNNYSLQYRKSGGETWTNVNLTYDTFVTNLGPSSWQTFDLNLFMATTSTKSNPLSITVTFKSIAV